MPSKGDFVTFPFSSIIVIVVLFLLEIIDERLQKSVSVIFGFEIVFVFNCHVLNEKRIRRGKVRLA